MEDRLITTKELAQMLGVCKQSIVNDRSKNKGFPYIKLGRKVRYRLKDLNAFFEANTITPRPLEQDFTCRRFSGKK